MTEFQQTTEEELWSMLGDASGHDRIEILAELAGRARYRGDFDRETTCLEQVAATALEIADAAWVADAHINLGSSRFNAEDYGSSVEYYGQAADEFAASGSSVRSASALWGQADAYRMLDDPDRSLETARESRRIAESEGVDALAGDACYLQALALFALKQAPEAIEACQSGRDHFRRAQLPMKVARIDDFAVTVYCHLDKYDEALELARGCLVLARESASESDDSHALWRLAEVLHRGGDDESALTQIGLAQQAFRSADDLIGCAKCERLRGDALFSLGRPQEAQDAYLDARILFDANGFDYSALVCEESRAGVLQWMGEYRQATQINERLVDLWSRGEDNAIDARWSAVRVLANLHDAQQYGECVERFEQYRSLWPDDATAEDPSYREFLGLTASAMSRIGRDGEAVAMAQHVINNTRAREASIGTAYCYEIRGRSRSAEDEVAGTQDIAHAIALHLAKGRVDWARDLSRDFLPVDPPSRISDLENPPEQIAGGH